MKLNAEPRPTTRAAWLAALAIFLLLLWGGPVPGGNEMVYLLAPYRAYHPGVMPGDWTFSRSWNEHWMYHHLIGMLSLVLPLTVLGWAGRIACWILGLLALLRLGRRFGLSDGQASLAIAIWLAVGQSFFGREYMLWTFEAQSIAYVLLLYALDLYLADRATLSAVLLGLSFSLHPSVGFSAALGFGAVLLGTRTPPAAVARFVGVALVCALPGIIPLIPSLTSGGVESRETWRLLTLIRMPYHLDALSFPRRAVLETYLLFGFCWLHGRRHPEDQTLQLSRWFLAGLALLCTAGIVARVLGRYELLQVYPFRVFPLFAPLFALFHLVRAYRDVMAGLALPWALAVLALLVVAGLPDPLGEASDRIQQTAELRAPPDDLAKAFSWLGAKTPTDALVIVPPWRQDSFWRTRRSQVVASNPPRPDKVAEWQRRMEALVGPLPSPSDPERYQRMAAHYDGLSQADLAQIRSEYGADYLVSRSTYSYPLRFQSGAWRVYQLSP
jgi:hypothetical protein